MNYQDMSGAITDGLVDPLLVRERRNLALLQAAAMLYPHVQPVRESLRHVEAVEIAKALLSKIEEGHL